MHTPFISKLLALAVALFCVGSTHAQVLLNVEWNPSTKILTLTATGNAPAANTTVKFYDGIILNDFFSSTWGSDTLGGSSVAGLPTLSDHVGTTSTLRNLWVDSKGSAFRALGVFNGVNNADLMDFTTAEPAFTGSASFNLNSVVRVGNATPFSDFIVTSGPGAGVTGDLYAGFSGTAGGPTLIGSWQMATVPEPSTYALLAGVSALGLVVWRRPAARRLAGS